MKVSKYKLKLVIFLNFFDANVDNIATILHSLNIEATKETSISAAAGDALPPTGGSKLYPFLYGN